MGTWIVTVKDHDSCLQFVTEVKTLENIPEALESLLGAGKAAWRPFKSYKRKNKKEAPKKK